MPKKLFPSEPPVIFQELYKAALAADRDFVVQTADATYTPFAPALIQQHYPSQHQLPLDD